MFRNVWRVAFHPEFAGEFRDLRPAQILPDRQAAIRARADELIAEEMTLRDLRKAIGKTQVALAKKLRIKQEAVSRAGQRTDMLLSTLDHYLHGLGDGSGW
jgi:hypothetical protein